MSAPFIAHRSSIVIHPLSLGGGIVAALLAGAIALAVAACGGSEPADSARPARIHVYEMRGQIAKLPDAGDADPRMFIRHEPIHDFINPAGQTEPMGAMTMPFHVAPDVSLAGLAAGDKVAFRWEMNWDANRERITRIARLAPDTALNLGHVAADPMGATPGMNAMPTTLSATPQPTPHGS
jgi:Cu/Ag efflux protein CusF